MTIALALIRPVPADEACRRRDAPHSILKLFCEAFGGLEW